MAGNNSIGTIRGTIEIDYDGAGIVRAVRDVDKLKNQGAQLDKVTGGIIRTFGRFAKAGALVAASSLATNSALQLVAGTLAVIGPLAAAGLATLPAFMLAGAAAGVILKVAMLGVGDALKAASKDTEEFNEAIKGLAPEAQRFAKAYRASLPALNAVKNAIQQAFFRDTAPAVGRVVKAVQSLRPQAVGVAAAFNRIVTNVVGVATAGRNVETLRAILSRLNGFLIQVRFSAGTLVQAFFNLARQGAAFGGTLGTTVNEAVNRFAAFLNNINLAELFEKAQPIVQALGGFLQNLMIIAGQLFQVFNVDGANAAGLLGQLAAQLAAFLQSAEGQQALQALGVALGAITSGAGDVFLALLKALGPILIALTPAIESLANSISSGLVSAIEELAPMLEAVAGFISRNIDVIGPLVGIITAAAVAYRIYTAAVAAWTAIQAVATALHLRSIAVWIAQRVAMLATRAVLLGVAAVQGGVFLASLIASNAALIARGVAMGAQLAIMAAIRVATLAWAAAQVALNVAMSLNPIGLIIIAIIALVAAIIILWKRSETFRNIIMAVWAAIKIAFKAAIDFIIAYLNLWWTIIRTVFNAVKSYITAVLSGIVAAVKLYLNVVRAVWTAVFNGIRAYVTTVFNAYRTIISAVINAIVSVVRAGINRVVAAIRTVQAIIAIVRNAFNSARTAAANAINSLVSLVKGIAGRVTGALGNLGSLLYNKGRDLVEGFIRGIKSMLGAVGNAAKSIVDKVTGFLPGSPAKEGPLSGRGYVYLRAQRMMADMARGMQRASSLPVKAMAGAVVPVAAYVPQTVSTGLSGGSTAPSTPAGPRTFGPYRMEVDGKVLSEFVIDAVTGAPVAVSKAAKEGDRRSSFAASGRR